MQFEHKFDANMTFTQVARGRRYLQSKTAYGKEDKCLFQYLNTITAVKG